jgi:predicted phosphodiesterase
MNEDFNKVVQNLHSIDGRLLFFGGVYSNLQALEALKKWAEANEYSPHNIFCTGDIIGYCAQPVECIEMIKDWGIHSIAGNVELQIREDLDSCGCDFVSGGRCELFSNNWYSYARSKIDEGSKDWLKTLPHNISFNYGKNKITLVHGSWFHTSEYIFKSTDWISKQKTFDATGSNVIIAGHCGLPFINAKNNLHWINAGVIGMPANDGKTSVWFCTLDNKKDELQYQLHQLEYDYRTASNLMKQNGLPPTYANTLSTGIWDNCEILPEEETAQQGKSIIL